MDNNNDQYNKGGLVAFVFSMVFCFVFFVYIAFVHPGVDLKEVAETVPADGVPVFNMSSVEKPWVPNEEVAKHGAKVYATNCAVCHGAEGKGDGAAGAGLNPKPRNLVAGGWKQGGDSISQYKTLQNGIPGGSMASFKHLPKADRWALVQFIHSITQDKTADDPEALEKFAATAD
jgi:mono/diheme cytochrome c family protein